MAGGPSRPVQARVVRNNARLLDAAVEELAESGWAGLSFARVATRAGLSRRPLQDRFDNASVLAAAVVRERSGPVLITALRAVLEAGGTLDAPIDRDRLLSALTALERPDTQLLAAIELTLIAQFDLAVRAAVRDTVGAQVEAWCTPVDGQTSDATAGQRGFLMSLALGLPLMSWWSHIRFLRLDAVVERLADALSAPAPPTPLPADVLAVQWDNPVPFDSGDPTLDALLQSVLDHVGADGFDHASVEQIVTTAGSSQGALFGRFDTKLELFLDAVRRQNAIALRVNQAFAERMAHEHGPGIGAAIELREMQRPGREQVRAVTLEQMRLVRHHPVLLRTTVDETRSFLTELAAADPAWESPTTQAGALAEMALTTGASVLATLHPAAWQLPYAVVTVPYFQPIEAHAPGDLAAH